MPVSQFKSLSVGVTSATLYISWLCGYISKQLLSVVLICAMPNIKLIVVPRKCNPNNIDISQDQVLKVKGVVLRAYSRAIRNVPWIVDVWTQYMLAQQRYQLHFSHIDGLIVILSFIATCFFIYCSLLPCSGSQFQCKVIPVDSFLLLCQDPVLIVPADNGKHSVSYLVVLVGKASLFRDAGRSAEEQLCRRQK